MPRFKDNKNREWSIELDVTTLRRVQSTLGVNLADVINSESHVFSKLQDPIFVCDVCYVIAKPQADVAGVDDLEFGSGFGGDSIAEATKALEEAIISFCPSQKARALLRQAVKANQDVQTRGLDLIEARMDQLGTLQERELKALDSKLDQTFGRPFISSQELSASSPVPSPGGN